MNLNALEVRLRFDIPLAWRFLCPWAECRRQSAQTAVVLWPRPLPAGSTWSGAGEDQL